MKESNPSEPEGQFVHQTVIGFGHPVSGRHSVSTDLQAKQTISNATAYVSLGNDDDRGTSYSTEQQSSSS